MMTPGDGVGIRVRRDFWEPRESQANFPPCLQSLC